MAEISKLITSTRPSLQPYEALYKQLHTNPELSFQEKETAATIAQWLAAKVPQFTVHAAIGGSTGIAAVYVNEENGKKGPIVMLRADMDGLPVQEKTGLEYASTKTMPDLLGNEKPVMHACGHDMHITSLLATAELLVSAKDHWKGTLILIFQPAEERGAGAQQMVDGGLYDLIPTPDVVVGGHVIPLRAGSIGTKRGLMACAADSFHLTIHGRQGHASQPHRTIDPIFQAASTITRLQTIVGREISPNDSAVVTVSAIHAGDAENIIPSHAELKLNVRNVDPATRRRVLASIRRIVDAEAVASNAEKMPELQETTSFPFTVNDPDATGRIEKTFAAHFGEGKEAYDKETERLPGSEDFGILATAVERPAVFFVYGGVDPAAWDKAEKEGRVLEDVPVNHSPFFAPVVQPTMTVAVDAYAAAALTWLAV